MADMNRRRALVLTAAVAAAPLTALPALAQQAVPKRDTAGWPIPPWLFPGAQNRARRACMNKEPNCRSAVRDQIELEKQISLLIPWAALGAAVIAVLMWLRAKERQKERHRLALRDKRDPKAFRNLDKTERPRNADGEEEEEHFDRLS